MQKLGFKILELKNFIWEKNRDHMINIIAKEIILFWETIVINQFFYLFIIFRFGNI